MLIERKLDFNFLATLPPYCWSTLIVLELGPTLGQQSIVRVVKRFQRYCLKS